MTALARPIEHAPATTHLRLAPVAVAVPDRTEVFPVDSFRRGCGTEAIAITTTTTIASDPALVAPAEQSLVDVDRTCIAMHVPVVPHPETTNVSTPPARADAAPERTMIVKPAPPMDVTNARVVVPGHYLLEDEPKVAFDVRVGTSMLLGRQPGSFFADDPYVDAEHTELTFRPDGVVVVDLDSTNGVFVRVRGSMSLRSGDQFRIGEELLSFTALKPTPRNGKAPALGSPDPGYWGRVDVLLGAAKIAGSYPIDDVEVSFGQTSGHMQFPDDPFVCHLHCRLVKEDRAAAIEDCGSMHGTWVRLRSGDVVPYDAELMIGHTLLRLERG